MQLERMLRKARAKTAGIAKLQTFPRQERGKGAWHLESEVGSCLGPKIAGFRQFMSPRRYTWRCRYRELVSRDRTATETGSGRELKQSRICPRRLRRSPGSHVPLLPNLLRHYVGSDSPPLTVKAMNLMSLFNEGFPFKKPCLCYVLEV